MTTDGRPPDPTVPPHPPAPSPPPSETPRLLVASANRGKRREIRALLDELLEDRIELVGLDSLGADPAFSEEGDSFAANAGAKALHYHKAHRLPALADDSGLVVDALDGEPGVRSSRYLGGETPHAAKMADIIRRLEEAGVPEAERGARFTCALAVAAAGRVVACIVKNVFGRIAPGPAGDGGFGYDPIFYCPELGATFGEASQREKDRVSHRAQALRILPILLRSHAALRRELGLGSQRGAP